MSVEAGGFRDAVAMLRLVADVKRDGMPVRDLTSYVVGLSRSEVEMAAVALAVIAVKNLDTDGRPFDDWLTEVAMSFEAGS